MVKARDVQSVPTDAALTARISSEMREASGIMDDVSPRSAQVQKRHLSFLLPCLRDSQCAGIGINNNRNKRETFWSLISLMLFDTVQCQC